MDYKMRSNCIDLARSFAILCVILTHTTENTYILNATEYTPHNLHSALPGLALFTIGRLGVPIFLFLTGYLLLDRDYSGQTSLRFWKHSLIPLLITTEIWIIIYHFFIIAFFHKTFDLMKLLKELTFLSNPDISHLWYMGQILGIYMFLPFLSKIIKETDYRIISILFFISFIFLFFPTTLNPLLIALEQPQIYPQINLNFFGGHYGLMIILGWFAKKRKFSTIPSWFLGMLACCSYSCTVLIQVYSYFKGITYNIWYDSVILVIAAYCLFLIFIRFNAIPFKGTITWIGYSSFAVYLVHNMFCVIGNTLFQKFALNNLPLYKEIFLFMFSLISSELIVYILSRNKHIAKILFYMK